MNLIIGSDAFGYPIKEAVKAHLLELGHQVEDIGCDQPDDATDYPDVATALAGRIASGEYERGVLVCGTGIGMAIVANKVPGVRAACCHDPYSAERARKSNNAQIIAFGAQIVGPALACSLLDHWLDSEFGGGRSTVKVEKIKRLDEHLSAGLAALEQSERHPSKPFVEPTPLERP
jgi:ribose 5-phosphate isomerase B